MVLVVGKKMIRNKDLKILKAFISGWWDLGSYMFLHTLFFKFSISNMEYSYNFVFKIS